MRPRSLARRGRLPLPSRLRRREPQPVPRPDLRYPIEAAETAIELQLAALARSEPR